MDGVSHRQSGEIIILEVHDLSSELKKLIYDKLVEICHGEFALVSGFIDHSFEYTIKELVENRIPESRSKIVGAIGELLLHVLIREFMDLEIVSPFFNLEERQVKKGFDIIAIDSSKSLWYIESKAGELGEKLDTATKKVCERINVARKDLDTRLNLNNSQLWLNAINSVRCSVDDRDEKRTILNILNENRKSCISKDKNIILGGTVFCVFDTTIDLSKLETLYGSIEDSNIFLGIKIIAIQKKTYQAIIDYLETLLREVSHE